MTKRLRLTVGCLFFALMFVNLWASIYADWQEKTQISLRGWEAMERDGKPVIYRVDRGGPEAELRVGDEVISLESPQKDAFPLLYQDGCYVLPGTIYTLIIRRGGETKEFTLKTIPFPFFDWISDWLTNLSLLIFLLTGLAVFLLKPADPQAWLLALMLGTFVGFYQGFSYGLSGWLLIAATAARTVGLAFLPLFFHIFLIFPERGPWLRRFSQLEILLYLPFLLTILPYGGLQRIGYYMNIEGLERRLPAEDLLRASTTIFFIAYLVGGLVALGWNYRVASAGSRRKLRFVVAGCGAACVNYLLIVLARFLSVPITHPQLYDWMSFPLLVTLPLIPISFAYAIIRHRVIPISLIIRRGVRYLLVSHGSVLVEMIAVSVILFLVMDKLFSWWNPSSGRIVGTVSAVVAIVWWVSFERLHRKWIAPAIDRRFFRQSYDSHQIMAELVESLRTTTSLPHLMEMVAIKIQTALQTESAAVLLRDESTGDYVSGYSCRYSQQEGKAVADQRRLTLPHKTVAVLRLEERGEPVEVVHQENGLSGSHPVDDNILLNSPLLLPLKAKDGMSGIISLGPRLGDVPFSREDKRLLMSVAGPTAFAIENARLVERMVEEARRHEEIEAENEARAKELEEARQLQLSMLPKRVPQLPHLEIAAYMKPATEVGGDYYDFHVGDDGTLTVAVGDATGHGLKAGTMVTAMKSLFRTFATDPMLDQILNRSSRILKEMNLRALFMALTMARLKEERLEVASAGMPPILIYRSQSQKVEEVAIKSMPLGSLTNYCYRSQSLALSAGDVIVMMSDGFPERFNKDGEILSIKMAKSSVILRRVSCWPNPHAAHRKRSLNASLQPAKSGPAAGRKTMM